MGSNLVGNNSDGMRSWSSNMDNSANEFDGSINKLYSLVEGFVNSRDFKGTLSDNFYNTFSAMRPDFLMFSEFFRGYSNLMKDRASKIDNTHSALNKMVNSMNYFNN